MDFPTAFTKLLGHEGAYSNNPKDPGGETMWGVTVAVARANGYTGAMNAMPQSVAMPIYKAKYWDAVHCDDMPDSVKYPLFDAAVNSGTVRAVQWLQAALGVAADGVIGAQTMAAVKAVDGRSLAAKMLSGRLTFMTNLPNWDTFGKGWARRVASLVGEI